MSSTDSVPQSQADNNSTEIRAQAEPLPSKRGEIGYVEGLHNLITVPSGNASNIELPERHPADRDAAAASPAVAPPTSSTSATTVPNSSVPTADATASSSASISKSSRVLGFLKPKKSFGGIQLSTILQFVAQLLLLGGTAVAWFFITKLMQRMSKNQDMPGGGSSTVFVHVVFVVGVIAQLVFLERRLFRLRGERYSFIHPGEILPRHRRIPMTSDSTAIAFAPWNRPPLPTYAAALAHSGVGTGDVEDHLIAAPPPPAYGNTRGSTLLLQGYLRNSLRLQRPPSVHSQASAIQDRHLSYVSRDEQWEEIQNADRAQQLEETLNRLESINPNLEGGASRQGQSR
ncbi:hypothetical protein BDN70DRAFT_873779 [Pholiota conissans]|uniref:Uncharacterized protein n=1 Tax=Pholiota conissans TaxID=109636 RepID=A0A9P6D4W8_9AGAR|nr:hypothetical protein BDN70DRAFT_873779 [Pholiota conissans]